MCLRDLLWCVRGVHGHLAPVHRCARSVRCFAGAVYWATWLLFTGVPALSVALPVPFPGPYGSCSPLCLLSVLCCMCGVLGHFPPVHRCACSVCCAARAVSWASWLLFAGVPARCVVLRVRCPVPLGSCSPVCPLRLLLCLRPFLGHMATFHHCARLVCCVACAVSSDTCLLFTAVPARCVVLLMRCPGPLGSCSTVCLLGALLCRCGVLGHMPPVHRCARVICCGASAVSQATWLLFTVAPARCVALLVRCPGPLGSCSRVCPLCVLCCACGVLGHLAPVHRCARSVRCFECALSWAIWLRFTTVPAWCVVLRVRCTGPLASCSPVCLLSVLCCVCGVLGHLASVRRCARSVCCVVCKVSWAPWLLFTGVLARCAVLGVRCPGPLGSCSAVCLLGVFCCVLPVRCCACRASLRGAHSSVRTAAVRSQQGLGTLRARTRPYGRRLFCSRQGLGTLPGAHSSIRTAAVRSRQGLGTLPVRTRPSGRRLFCSWQGLGLLRGAHTSVRTAAGVAFHLSSCRGLLRVERALRVRGTRRPLLLHTCP